MVLADRERKFPSRSSARRRHTLLLVLDNDLGLVALQNRCSPEKL